MERKRKLKMKTYPEEIGFKKCPREVGPVSMKDLRTSSEVDEKPLVRKILESGSGGCSRVQAVVDVKAMKLEEKNVARVLPGRITEVKFLPTKDMRMLVVGNEHGNVAFWNVDSEDNGIYVYHPHPALVSGISIHPYSLSKIMTSCYDGFVRLLDLEKESFGVTYQSESHQLCSIARRYESPDTLFIGEGYGNVGVLDIRSPRPCYNSRPWSLHREKIYTIDFHSHLMATSSKDGTACIWDLRKLDHFHQPQPLKRVRHKSPVNSAYFSPSGHLLATTSKDDNIGLVSGTNYEVESMIYHSNKTSRFISSFRGIWGWDDSYIMVGNKKKGVDIICAQQKKVSYTLASPKINAIPCRFDAHPMLPGVLAISTAGGRVYVWDI